MNSRKKKILAVMIMSAMMTCPVWANNETAATDAASVTGYEPAQGTAQTTSAATNANAPVDTTTEKIAVNATVTSPADASTTATMDAAKSGLTGYETPDELAAIKAGKTPAEVHAAAENKNSEATTPAPTSDTTGYEKGTATTVPVTGTTATTAPATETTTPAPVAPVHTLPGQPVQLLSSAGDFTVDSTVPGYPMAVFPVGQEGYFPYGDTVSDDVIKPYVDKVATTVTISPVPDKRIESQILPRLAMRVGDAVNLDYIKHDLNVIGSTGLFSTVKPAFTAVPEGTMLNYTVQMNPVINSIDITGNESISTADLLKLIPVTPGTVLNTAIISKNIADINTAYGNAGYMMSRVKEVSLDDKGVLHIGIGEAHVEDILLRGNTKTRNKVILRELRFKKGDIFNKNTASRSIQRVYNTGYFEDVNVRLLPGKLNPNDVIVEIDVVEQKTGTITIGAGYSDSDGLVGILGMSETNFRGTGDKVSINWEFGGNTNSDKNYIFSYTHPYLNDAGDSIGFSIYDRESEYDDYNQKGDTVASYDKRTKGYNVTYGRVRSEYVSDFVTVETKETKYTGYEGGINYETDSNAVATNYLGKNFGRTNSLTWSHVFDNRDNVYDPTKGKRLSFTTTWAGHGLGGDFDYFKFIAENRLYYKVGRAHVLALRLMGGIATGDMPYNDLFTLGGADNLRGYEDDEFRGNKMYAATLEYRYPIAKKIQGVVFVDAGNAWGGTDDIFWYHGNNKLHFSGGVGFRITTPIGPVRLDYGEGTEGGKFHFSFGGKF